jgi:hypothetical protein
MPYRDTKEKKNHLQYKIDNLKIWNKNPEIEYKTLLEKSDNIDVAFSTNVFALMPE